MIPHCFGTASQTFMLLVGALVVAPGLLTTAGLSATAARMAARRTSAPLARDAPEDASLPTKAVWFASRSKCSAALHQTEWKISLIVT